MTTRPTTSTICSNCGVEFLQDRREKNRQLRNGKTRFFCSRSCSAAASNQVKSEKRAEASRETLKKLRIEGRTRSIDEFSPFRYYIRKAKDRVKKGKVSEADLDLHYLKELWDSQEGKCAYTNIILNLNQWKGMGQRDYASDPRFLASLDRIDSSKGYVKGNVQFISASLNYGKGTLTDAQFREFIEMIRQVPVTGEHRLPSR